MASLVSCPKPDELSLLLVGRLPGARSAAVEEHLHHCEHCLEIMEDLQVESQLVTLLRSFPRLTVPRLEPDLEMLITQLEELPLPAERRSADVREEMPELAPAEASDEIGRLAHFRVLRILGVGGMGVVYAAEDLKLQRPVALKVLRPRMVLNPEAHARFWHEAQTIAAIKHDHVVVVHEVGEAELGTDGTRTPFLAMELLDGESMHLWMRKNPRPPLPLVLRLVRQTAAALESLHSRGVIHRDVKPANLWLERLSGWRADAAPLPSAELGRVKLLDFGLAFSVNSALAEARALGTPAYMAPEQLRGDSLDARCDLFGLGCVLYELCTGEHPFPDRRFSREHVTPFPVEDLNPDVSPRLAMLIARLLREEPADRPASTNEVIDELIAIESAASEPDNDIALPPLKTSRQIPWRAVTLAACILSAFVAGIFWSSLGTDWSKAAYHDEAWCKEVRTLPAKQQVKQVLTKLEELNPGYSQKKFTGWIEPEAVLRFNDRTDIIHDIRPIRCLADLKTLVLRGSEPGRGKLTDLRPLMGLRLFRLELQNNPALRDLTPLRGMPLNVLNLSHTAVTSVADLADLPIEHLHLVGTPVEDLTPVRTLFKLKEIVLDFQPARDAETLRGLGTLQQINGMAVKDFWRTHPPR